MTDKYYYYLCRDKFSLRLTIKYKISWIYLKK